MVLFTGFAGQYQRVVFDVEKQFGHLPALFVKLGSKVTQDLGTSHFSVCVCVCVCVCVL